MIPPAVMLGFLAGRRFLMGRERTCATAGIYRVCQIEDPRNALCASRTDGFPTHCYQGRRELPLEACKSGFRKGGSMETIPLFFELLRIYTPPDPC